jgi:hypothetical protein
VTLPTTTANVTVITMPSVPAGSYVFMAKTSVVQTNDSGGSNSSSSIFTRCTLNGDPSTNVATDDYAVSEPGRGNASEVGRATLHTQLTMTLATPTSITLICRRGNSGGSGTVVARESKIIRIAVGSTSRTAVTG